MRTATKRYVEQLLRDYPDLDKYIKKHKEELRYPIKDYDKNVSISKNNKIARPEENLVITLDEDKRLRALQRQKEIIGQCIANSGEVTQIIVQELYFKKHPKYTTEGLAIKLKYAKTYMYKLKLKLIERVASALGIYDP